MCQKGHGRPRWSRHAESGCNWLNVYLDLPSNEQVLHCGAVAVIEACVVQADAKLQAVLQACVLQPAP